MMANPKKLQNPISEYLLKIQLIISNTEFKDNAEARKYETVDSKLNGERYCCAMLKEDHFESYEYDPVEVYSLLYLDGMEEQEIRHYMENLPILPYRYQKVLLERARERFIASYKEPNKYYVMLTGKPFAGDKDILPDPVVLIPDGFYELYKDDYVIIKDQPVHELPDKYMELFLNSEYYNQVKKEYPDCRYLNYIGSNAIPIHVSRRARDGDILKINTGKLSTYHSIFGNVTVSADIMHAYVNIYNATRDYVYYTLRGNFSSIYENYDSFIRFLTIYLSIGNACNEFLKKSSKLIYMNNTTANNLFTLYGLPSVIMEGNSLIEFLKKFRLLLMDKGTNVVYRVKDIIGYEYTDIYTLIMVKQQIFENGVPVYEEEDGIKKPKQNIVFRRFGTTDDNTSYFKFREEIKEYSIDEITSGDPRWWNTKEVEEILQNANYTLSNSKYIQLSTNISMTDIWWDCVILLRGLLDNKNQTMYTDLNVNFNINGKSTMTLFEAVLTLVILMNWHMVDFKGNTFNGELYIPNGTYNGTAMCIDMLFNGLYMAKLYHSGKLYKKDDVVGLSLDDLYIVNQDYNADAIERDIENGYLSSIDTWDDGAPKEFSPGLPYKIASFNFDFRDQYYDFYRSIEEMEFIEPDIFLPMLDRVLDMTNMNLGETLMNDVKLIYQYLETKLRTTRTIRQFRQVTDIFNKLFLVDPVRNWNSDLSPELESTLCEKFNMSTFDWRSLCYFFKEDSNDFDVEYKSETYQICIHNILTKDIYTLSLPFDDISFVNMVETELKQEHDFDTTIKSSGLSDNLKNHYKDIILYKIKMNMGNTDYGPKSFETLLLRQNPDLYDYLLTMKSSPDNLIMLLRAIIKALESYSNSPIGGLEFKALGIENYLHILKEVISYFKSYMVEFTKEEFTYLFDGLFDNGGNSNMIRLYDEMTYGNFRLIPKSSLTLYDVSCATVKVPFNDTGLRTLHDELVVRMKAKYSVIKNAGYAIWYDNGKRITKEPSFVIDDNEKVVVNIVELQDGSKAIIIPIQNTDSYYGNTR